MKKNQLIKALVFTAVLAAFPAAGLSASAEDAAPADALAIDNAAPVAAQAEDVVLAPVTTEAAPVVVETAPAVVEAAPAVDEAAPAVAEGTKNGKADPCDPDTKVEVTVGNGTVVAAPAAVDTVTKATIDDAIIKAGNDTKITTTVTPGKYIVTENAKDVAKEYKVGVRYFSSDNSIATVDPDGTVHAKKPGKVTIYVQTVDGTEEVQVNVSESYNVLLIDKTDSTGGKTLAKEKAAAISYAEEVLKVNSENHIAVVQIGDQVSTKTLSSFTNNLKDIKNTINGITASNEYSVYSAGFKKAAELLNSIPYPNAPTVNKNVVLFGDGCATAGDRDYAEKVLKDMLYSKTITEDVKKQATDADGHKIYEREIYVLDTTTNKYVTAKQQYVEFNSSLYLYENGAIAAEPQSDLKVADVKPVYTTVTKTASIDGADVTADVYEDASGNEYLKYNDKYYVYHNATDGYVEYKPSGLTLTQVYVTEPKTTTVDDTLVNFYAFGIYDGATAAEKSEGEAFLKKLAKKEIKDLNTGKTYTADTYFEVGNVKDLAPIYKAIATKKVTKNTWTDSYVAAFDTYVYGKDCCAKKCNCTTSDSTVAKKSASETDSPVTAESNSIYVIALFALLGAGAMGVSAKKRFED